MAEVVKAQDALKTISEVSEQFAIPQHILRYWETRFPQLRPLQRAGNRRYYRPADVALVGRIHTLLNRDGYTIKGVRKLLSSRGEAQPAPAMIDSPAPMPLTASAAPPPALNPEAIAELRRVRAQLAAALAG
jgi:DNA-binding transcriptional MerR regulator